MASLQGECSNDFIWLDDIIVQLRNYNPSITKQIQEHKKSASVAIVIRVITETDTLDFKDLNLFLQDEKIRKGQVHLLYIKRAIRALDPFSGDVAFPGGKTEKGESAKDCAIRETMEELNLDLLSPDFCFIGNLTPCFPGGGSTNILVYPFVWVQLSSRSIPLSLQPTEVAGAFWVPLSLFSETERLTLHQSIINKHMAIELTPIEIFSKLSPEYFTRNRLHLWGLTMRFTIELFSISSIISFPLIEKFKKQQNFGLTRQNHPERVNFASL